MGFSIGQCVVYPTQGVARVEEIRMIQTADGVASFYILRIETPNSVVMVPVANARGVGVRLPIGRAECERLLECLAAGFDDPPANFKDRKQEFLEKARSGDVFVLADVLKKLTYLNSRKPLSEIDKRMLERARTVLIGEVAVASRRTAAAAECAVDAALATACAGHAPGRSLDAGAAP
jgi:CarD family transcriptional regulator